MKKEDVIESTALFEGLSSEEIEAVATLLYEKKFGKGETIFFEGDEANGFYLVSSGQIKVFKIKMNIWFHPLQLKNLLSFPNGLWKKS